MGRKKRSLKRNWPEYNENLVVRGEFFLELDWVKTWYVELDVMNEGKRGRKFEYPDSLIRLQALWYQFVDYRGLEGITRKLRKKKLLPACNDFSTIWRRIVRLKPEFKLPKDKTVMVACDGTGIRLTNGGVYKEQTYGMGRKKYIKVTITSDVKCKKIIECDVEIECKGDSEPDMAYWHTRYMMHKGLAIKKFFADGAFDKIEFFQFLEELGIEAVIKTRKDAVDSGKNTLRDKQIKELEKNGYKNWSKKHKYGLRWNATEGIFSSVKRKFGENVKARKPENALKEAKMKFWLYDEMREYAKERLQH